MPGLLDKAVSRVKQTGQPTSNAWAIATSALQKAGDLKRGSNTPTAKGVARNQMTRAQRQAKPP